MRNALQQYLQKHKSNLFISITAFFLVAFVFLGYVQLVGIPRTTARNLYNQGEIALQAGRRSEALQLWNEAYQAWPEQYIQTAIQSVVN